MVIEEGKCCLSTATPLSRIRHFGEAGIGVQKQVRTCNPSLRKNHEWSEFS